MDTVHITVKKRGKMYCSEV